MAVSGKTAILAWPYFLGTDKPPDMAAVTKAQAERAEALLVPSVAELGVYRTLLSASAAISNDAAGSTDYVLSHGASRTSGGVVVQTGLPASDPAILYFRKAAHAVEGKTQKLLLDIAVFSNATAPGVNFTFRLQPISAVGGTADNLTFTLGSAVSSLTLPTPSASNVSQAVGSDFAIPSDGAYVLVVALSGTLVNNSACYVTASLKSHYV